MEVIKLLHGLGLYKKRMRLKLFLQKVFFSHKFDILLEVTPPCFVYQMGKVGSTSIYFSIKQAYSGVTLRSHEFGPNVCDWRINKLYEHHRKNLPLNIVSLTREPIGRNISAFFQNFKRDTGVAYRNSDFTIKELKHLFLNNYEHKIPLEWFDKHIKYHFNIDVYKMPFSEKGVKTYSKENVRLIVIRSELSDEIKASALRDFLDTPEIDIIQKNVGRNKIYAEEYQQFKQEVELPAQYVDQMCNSKYFKYFYGKDNMKQIKQKWIQ